VEPEVRERSSYIGVGKKKGGTDEAQSYSSWKREKGEVAHPETGRRRKFPSSASTWNGGKGEEKQLLQEKRKKKGKPRRFSAPSSGYQWESGEENDSRRLAGEKKKISRGGNNKRGKRAHRWVLVQTARGKRKTQIAEPLYASSRERSATRRVPQVREKKRTTAIVRKGH